MRLPAEELAQMTVFGFQDERLVQVTVPLPLRAVNESPRPPG